MIEILTQEKLMEYGFGKDAIIKLLGTDPMDAKDTEDGKKVEKIFPRANHEERLETGFIDSRDGKPKGFFWASNVENEIHSDKDGWLKIGSFPSHDMNLIDDYYQIRLKAHKDYEKNKNKNAYVEEGIEEEFIKEQLKLFENSDHPQIRNYFRRLKKKYKEITSQEENGSANLLTLKTNLTEDQLKKLHKKLNEKYIKTISENNFVHLLTSKPINGIDKIKWLKTKTMAVYLFDKICLDFSFSILNKCVEKNNSGFDHNNRSKVKFDDIEEILKSIK